ncbi:MAG: putative sulfate exporter family transporter [Bacteroidales bacterium]|nr:putative sulfate exporter family transporter [Bacteroidales bacterium]MBD5281514.1 putative sulfate exporter family transporter [Bacteroides sp.]MDE6033891.1 putative sulfate exporter family transporter [Muribaculaceae bacterium]MBD5294390.1 putative sulfate exporter family transporter [Bacteroides sp.]MBD5342275.1 putative sulfate exporter family transporter [Bacteroides sp.]
MKQLSKWIYILIVVLILVPFSYFCNISEPISPAIALLLGLILAFTLENPFPKFNKKCSKYLLQASVVGYGFSMNLQESLKSGAEGMAFTVCSVIGLMVIGVMLGYWLHIERKTAYLISSGTAICGGSAIAAVGPVVKANDHEMAVSLGVIFILNAIALFIFPPLGHMAGMTETQFGTWAAIAIHDTSSVVGAGDAYGPKALEVATLIKLTRALWIIPLALVTMAIFRDKTAKISIPWFIFLFILAMVINTYAGLPVAFGQTMAFWAKKGMVLTLFMIGASLSLKSIKAVGFKPLILAVALWVIIGVTSFFVVINTID